MKEQILAALECNKVDCSGVSCEECPVKAVRKHVEETMSTPVEQFIKTVAEKLPREAFCDKYVNTDCGSTACSDCNKASLTILAKEAGLI